MIPVDVYNELTARRRKAADQAAASVRAEGLAPPAAVELIIDEWGTRKNQRSGDGRKGRQSLWDRRVTDPYTDTGSGVLVNRLGITELDGEANIEASIASLRGDNAPLRRMLDGLVRR